MDQQTIKDGNDVTEIAGQLLDTFDFDSVVILATKRDSNGCNCYHGMAGNWFAIYGSVNDWLIRADNTIQNGAE